MLSGAKRASGESASYGGQAIYVQSRFNTDAAFTLDERMFAQFFNRPLRITMMDEEATRLLPQMPVFLPVIHERVARATMLPL